jgi:hypothetical protein
MAISSGSVVYGADYNKVQTQISQILGTGTGAPDQTYGYGKTTQSDPVAAGQPITRAQWNALATDVNTIYTHQTGTNYPNYSPVDNGLVSAVNYNLLNNTVASLVATRMTVSATQLTTSQLATSVYGAAWGAGNQGIENTLTITFASTDAMKYFFNTGCSLRIQGTGPNQSGSQQDSSWQTTLTGFNYTLGYSQFSALTGNPAVIQTLNIVANPYYSNSYIRLTGSVSGATITFVIRFYDAIPTNFRPTWGGSDSVSDGAGFILYQTASILGSTSVPIGSTPGNWSLI